MIELRIPGKPTGKGRPRFNGRRAFTDKTTQLAEARVERAWETAGSPRLPDGPIVFTLTIAVDRPQAHHRKNGTLTPAGEREPWPRKKPDADNALKLAMDALNGKAYRDDVDIVHAWVVRRWTTTGETEHSVIRISPMPTPAAEQLAA